MNRQRLGAIFLFAGIFLYGIIHIAAVIHVPLVTVWATRWGRYLEAVSETGGLIGLVVAILLFVAGVVILLTVLMADFPKGKMMQEIRERNREFEERYGNNIRNS
ncbi:MULTISPECIES: hypothetical protein [Paenibacillus]|uniref:Uncharacterized protein n=1 Tax=Paenibacillus xylanilyticus TaxID=248903 RepID=A0A7Y6C2R6_9BACL|nr:hypothetical protein [Paenibacillus xylanilyticus]NUU78710.1 hypothetical protein [Paenibacillus xylanilyticus]